MLIFAKLRQAEWNSISGSDAWYHFRFNISCDVAVTVRSHLPANLPVHRHVHLPSILPAHPPAHLPTQLSPNHRRVSSIKVRLPLCCIKHALRCS